MKDVQAVSLQRINTKASGYRPPPRQILSPLKPHRAVTSMGPLFVVKPLCFVGGWFVRSRWRFREEDDVLLELSAGTPCRSFLEYAVNLKFPEKHPVSHVPPRPRIRRSKSGRKAKKFPPERSFRRKAETVWWESLSCNKWGKLIFRPSRLSPFPFRRESSEASRGGTRRNSRQNAVFGKAGNGTVVGISELARKEGFELRRATSRAVPPSPKSL